MDADISILGDIITELEKDIVSVERGEQDNSLHHLLSCGPLDSLKNIKDLHLSTCNKLKVILPTPEQFFKRMHVFILISALITFVYTEYFAKYEPVVIAPAAQQKKLTQETPKASQPNVQSQSIPVAKAAASSPAKQLSPVASPVSAMSTRHSIAVDNTTSKVSTPVNQVVTRKRGAEVVVGEASAVAPTTRRSTRQSVSST